MRLTIFNKSMYSINVKRFLYPVFLLLFFVLSVPYVEAASLSTIRDTITTSRPSPSSPLSAGASSGASQVSIFNNGSRFLASDSAKLKKTATATDIDAAIIVSSQSAALTTVFFGDTTGATAVAAADVLLVPITAMHTIQFTTVNTIPVSGKIVLTFPTLAAGDSDDDASPSATTFQFNNVVAGGSGTSFIDVFDDAADVSSNVTITETEPSSGAPGVITITLDGATSISAGSVVKVYLGCTASTSSSCTTQSPLIINPTKTATAGTADAWKIRVSTQDAASSELDFGTSAVGIIDSVQIQATVDPSLTFTIAGISNGSAINTGNTTGCTNTETTNSGITSTSTFVNLGILGNTPTAIDTKVGNIAAQLLTVSTNAANGYSLTATSSGAFRDNSSGFDIASSTTPAVFPNGTPWFGLHPCGLDVGNSTTWTETGASQNCSTQITGSAVNECKYGWPTQTVSLTLASDASGPIGNAIAPGNGMTSVEYASGVDVTVPAGNYQSYITYVATPTF